MAYSIPACIVYFYLQPDGRIPRPIAYKTVEEAYQSVCIRDKEIELVLLLGDVYSRKMAFRSYEAYLHCKNQLNNPLARAIFHRIVGEYSPIMRKRWKKEQEERRRNE